MIVQDIKKINETFEVIESEKNLISMLKNICQSEDINYSLIYDSSLLE